MAASRLFKGFNPIVPITVGSSISNPERTSAGRATEVVTAKPGDANDPNLKRPKGRASTLLTGPNGLLGAPGITRRTLIGY